MSQFERSGGRAADQLRPVRLTRHFTIHAEGSVLVEFGQTRVDRLTKVTAGGPVTQNGALTFSGASTLDAGTMLRQP